MTTFKPDKRPIAYTTPFGALYGLNSQGLDPTWISDPQDWIAAFREVCDYCQISRRGLFMPQGSLASPSNYPASNSGVLFPNVLAYFTNDFEPRTGEEWMIYSGRILPDNLQQDSMENGVFLVFADDQSGADFIATALQLYGDAGFVSMGLDASSDAPDFCDMLTETVTWLKSPVIAEAYPIINSGVAGSGVGGVRWDLNFTELRKRPFLAVAWAYILLFDPDDLWVVPDDCEVHAIVRGDEKATSSLSIAYYESLKSRGFIVGPAHGAPQWVLDWVKNTYHGGSGVTVKSSLPKQNGTRTPWHTEPA